MAKDISLLGATYHDVPAVTLPKSGGGTASFTDVTDTTATASDVAAGTYFYAANGARTAGTATLGGNVLVVTLSWDDQNELWVPDKTFAEICAAYYDGKEIAIEEHDAESPVNGYFEEDGEGGGVLVYYLDEWQDEIYQIVYIMDGSGVSVDTVYGPYIEPNFDSPSRTYTPTEQQQTETITPDTGYNGIEQVSVTVNAIPSSYVGSGITRRDSTDLSASGATVSVPAGYYASSASKAVASGSVSASATKGSVSNHSVQVTPSASVTAGYISSGVTGTAVTVQASELVSGSQTIQSNGPVDVTNLASVVVDVQGGTPELHVDTKDVTPASASSSIQFTGLAGEPTSFSVVCRADLSTGSPYKVAAVAFDGSSTIGQYITNTSNAQMTYDGSAFSHSYSNGTLTVTCSGANFQEAEYILCYTYGGGTIASEQVQVGSGVTSITFTGISDEPEAWTCIFTSNIGTSSGYTRAHVVAFDGSSIYGCEMGSGSQATAHWSASFSNGSLTISSQSTSQGGYFHQPGYYELVYAIGGGNYQSKTVTPTTSAQTVTADSGYDALKRVNVEAIPSQYIIPTGNIAITSNTGTGQSLDISQYATATVNVPTGGGGASTDTKNVTASNRPSTLSFTSMKGQPIAFFLKATFTMTSSSSTYYYVDSMRGYLSNNSYSVEGRLFRMGSTRQTENVTSGYSASYSGTTLTLTSTGNRTTSPGCYYNGSYELVYVY